MGHSVPDLGPETNKSDIGGNKGVNLYDTNPNFTHKITRGNPSKLPTTVFWNQVSSPQFMGSHWNNDPSKNSPTAEYPVTHVCTTFGSEPLRGCRTNKIKEQNPPTLTGTTSAVQRCWHWRSLHFYAFFSCFRAVAHWLFNACPGRWSDFPPLKN